MSLFPPAFDTRSDLVIALMLAKVTTVDGAHGFIIGADGRFVDVDGGIWWGSQLLSSSDLEFSIGGVAPSGIITFSFFQDPDAPDLIAQVQALGFDYLSGQPIDFYVQPFASHEEMTAPVMAPIRIARRTIRRVSWTANAARDRSISVSFEGPFEARGGKRGRVYSVTDHGVLIGSPNPSLTYMPRQTYQDQKLFG